MQTIVLATQKGGSGKSTLAIGLALAAIQAGHTVRLIETDSQGTLSNWQSRRPYAEPIVEPVYVAGDVEQRLQSLERDGVTLTIIDTAGGVSAATTSAIRHADFCLIPARPSVADIEATASTLSVVRAWNKPFAFILNQTPIRGQRLTNAATTLGDEAALDLADVARAALHRDAQRPPGCAERGPRGQRICAGRQIGRRNPRPLAVGRGQAQRPAAVKHEVLASNLPEAPTGSDIHRTFSRSDGESSPDPAPVRTTRHHDSALARTGSALPPSLSSFGVDGSSTAHSLLALRAPERRTAVLGETPDDAAAACGPACLAFAVIDLERMLEIAEFAGGQAMIADRGAAGLDRLVQHRMDRIDQTLGMIGGLAPFLVASVAANRRGDRCERNSASQT